MLGSNKMQALATNTHNSNGTVLHFGMQSFQIEDGDNFVMRNHLMSTLITRNKSKRMRLKWYITRTCAMRNADQDFSCKTKIEDTTRKT